ncbi:MAG: hypothetical protein U1F14_04755 [Steroidobacteraceae bacterium]
MNATGYPPRGHFEWRTLVGAWDADPMSGSHFERWWDLHVDGSYPLCTMRDADGIVYSCVRRIANGGDSIGFVLQTNVDGRDLRIHPRSAEGYSGPVVQKFGNGAHRLSGGGQPPAARAFALELDRSTVRWQEAGLLDVEGRIIGPGLQWYTPWPKQGGAFYATRMYRARGTILGKPVEGFMGFDQYCFPPGFAYANDPFVQDIELSYVVFGNEYDDGTIEVGQMFFGHGRWAAAMVNNEQGPIILTTTLHSEITARDERGYAARIRYRVEGEDWEFIADPTARMPDFGEGVAKNPGQEGRFQRVGDRRGLVAWWAWTETVPSHGELRRALTF